MPRTVSSHGDVAEDDWEEFEIGDSLENADTNDEDDLDDNAQFDSESGDEGTRDSEEASQDDDTEDAEESGSSDNRAEHDAEETATKNLTDEKKKGGSRSADRIAELAAALKQQEQESKRILAEIRERDLLRATEAQLSVRENVLANSRKELEGKIKTLENQYLQAREDSNSALELQVMKDLRRAELELLATDTDLNELKTNRETLQKNPPKAAVPNAANPKAVAWLNRNPWIANLDEDDTRAIAAQVERLLKKGGDPNSDELYDKIDVVVDSWLKANDIKDYAVNFRVNPKPTGKEKTMEKDVAKSKPKSNQPTREKNTGEGLVLGKTKDGKTRVKVTEDDREMAKRLGVPLDKYMKERVKTDKIFDKNAKEGVVWSNVF